MSSVIYINFSVFKTVTAVVSMVVSHSLAMVLSCDLSGDPSVCGILCSI